MLSGPVLLGGGGNRSFQHDYSIRVARMGGRGAREREVERKERGREGGEMGGGSGGGLSGGPPGRRARTLQ